MINFFRKFIPDFGTIALPLTSVMSGKVDFVWGEAQQHAFDTLKALLCADNVLKMPNLSQSFVILTNASHQGRLNCVADALSRAPLPTEDIPANDYLETKEPTRYWPDWNVKFYHPDDPVDSPSKEEIKSTELSGEGEGDTDEGQKVTLYSALTDLSNEVPPTRVDIIAEQRKDPFCILVTEYLMLDDEQKKKKNEKFSKEFKEKAKGFLLDSQMIEANSETTEPDPYGMIVNFHPTFEEELNDSGAGFKAYIPPTLICRVIFACHGHPLSGHAGISKTLHRVQQLYF
uniref:RNA-directed DNA polymerase n=1 Tax=Strigamia maritima TaxID=126957 RepID=T1IZ04_STRMM